jgi:hypothetical protein
MREVSVHPDCEGGHHWLVEWFDSDGGCYVTTFNGPLARAAGTRLLRCAQKRTYEGPSALRKMTDLLLRRSPESRPGAQAGQQDGPNRIDVLQWIETNGSKSPCRFAFHLIEYLPGTAAPWVAQNLKNALIINVVLAVFNLFPLPPLDGGHTAVGVLPDAIASPLARLEPYGMLILIGLLFILPMLGAQMGVDVNIIWRFIPRSANAMIDAILRLAGNL